MGNDDNNAIVPKGDETPTSDDGRVMRVTADTDGIDFDGILADLIQYANIADAIAHVEKSVEYVVQIPVKYREAFEAGELLINQNSSTGVMWPSLYRALESGKRELVCNLPIKPEQMVSGNPFETAAISYHNLYMQQKLGELTEAINATYNAVARIERGQMDDRIGYLLAGRDHILFAMNSSSDSRLTAIETARGNMLVAQKQILQTFKRRVSDFEPIPKSKLRRFLTETTHSGSLRQKDKEFDEIQEYFSLYLQATQMIASSYAVFGDIEAADRVYKIAEQDMKEINFDAMRTLRYIHDMSENVFYLHTADYVAAEREICIEEAREYDLMSLEVSGEKLLEVFENVRAEEIH